MLTLRRWCAPTGGLLLAAALVSSPSGPSKARAAQNADGKANPSKWQVDTSVALKPAAQTVPALKYRLLPLTSELKRGNAVPIYLRLVHEQNDATQRIWRDKPAAWNKLPLAQLPIAECQEFLKTYKYLYKQLELGARCRDADWNYTLDAGDPIGILLPDAQNMRVYGAMLALKARVAIAQGDYDSAAHTLQTGFALSRHVGEGPFLITGMVGVALVSGFEDVLLDWVSRPDAPSIYWPLASLPRPMIDLRRGYDFERRMVELQFPDMANLKRPRSPAEWDATLRRVRIELQPILALEEEHLKKKDIPDTKPNEPASASPELPAAKKYLVERLHMPSAKVESMAAAQVLLLHMSAINDDLQDDMYKGVYLPAHEAIAITQAAHARLKATPATEATRFPRLMLAAAQNVVISQTRMERRLAALRTIEALRLYAAAHNGQLPAKLSDIKEVPVPVDPGTGEPFAYSLDNTTATLIAPPLNVSARATGLRFRVSVK